MKALSDDLKNISGRMSLFIDWVAQQIFCCKNGKVVLTTATGAGDEFSGCKTFLCWADAWCGYTLGGACKMSS